MEFTGGRGDHLRRDVAAATLAAHVVERVADGGHVETLRCEVLFRLFHVYGYVLGKARALNGADLRCVLLGFRSGGFGLKRQNGP